MKDTGMRLALKPIGVIHSPYTTKEKAPIQGIFRPEVTGWVERGVDRRKAGKA